MLRYHMAVVTRDPALKRAVKRLTTATGSTADFVVDAASLQTERRIDLAIYDARQHAPPKELLAKVPKTAKIVYIIEGDSLIQQIPLLQDERVTSLFCYDERFDDDEFICTATKALRGEPFGLQKHFPWGVTTFTMGVKNHEEKGRAIEVLLEYASLAGVRGGVRDRIQLVCDELMMNALYHAPTDANGKELYAGRTLKELAQLPEVNPIRVTYGCSGAYFGVSVKDGGGSLGRARLLDYLLRAKTGATIENKATGAGLGLVSVLKSVSKLLFHIDPRNETEVVALFDMELFAKGKMGARSLHLFSSAPRPAEASGGDEAPQAAGGAPAAPPSRGWIAVAALSAVVAALGTAVVMKKSAAPAHAPPTLVVYPEPADAVVKLDGRAVSPGTPIPLPDADATVSIEKDGYRSYSIRLPAAPGQRQIHVTLSR